MRDGVLTLARHVAGTMPWGPLLAGCGTGICVSLAAALSRGATQQPPQIVLGVRASFVPVMVGLAFLLHDPHRQLTAALPARAWLTSAVRVALALPVVAVTCSAELYVAAQALAANLRAAGAGSVALPWTALAAEFAAWCLLALAAGAVVARTRWHDLGGVVAAPCAIAALAILGLAPLHLLPTAFTDMTAAERHAWTLAWRLWAGFSLAAIAAAAWASRDPWLRARVVRIRRISR